MGARTMRAILCLVFLGFATAASVVFRTVNASSGLFCPNASAFRTAHIREGFDASKLVGLWYEQGFEDPAQVGASCPWLNNTFHADTNEIEMSLHVHYGFIPFTLVERYTPVESDPSGNTNGMYSKTAEMPGGSLLKLPTAVVDATPHSSGGTYETMTLFSCTVGVQELVIATRDKTISTAQLEALKATARTQGVEFSDSDLTVVNQSSCDDSR